MESEDESEDTDESGNEVVSHHENKKKDNVLPTTRTVTSRVEREVRVVHAHDHMLEAGRKDRLWLYIPQNKGDKSEKPRKGWWLYPEAGQPGKYYIGHLQGIQTAKKKNKVVDVVVFKDFPFIRTAVVDGTDK